MWESLSFPWKVCFEEAWEAYCNGSIPIGAALVGNNDRLISRARNRINESSCPPLQTCSNKLAHAEINVLLQVDKTTKIKPDDILYTTTEPCVLCFGAIVMSGVRKVRFAAFDFLAGGSTLNKSNNTLIRERNIEILEAPRILGIFQRVIRIEFVLRYLNQNKAKDLLKYETIGYEVALDIAQNWYRSARLYEAMKKGHTISKVIDDIADELRSRGKFEEVDSFV